MSDKEGRPSIKPSFDGLLEPTHAFIDALLSKGRAGLNVPNAIFDHAIKVEELRDLFNIACHGLILLVCKDQEWRARKKTIILSEAAELILGLFEAHPVS